VQNMSKLSDAACTVNLHWTALQALTVSQRHLGVLPNMYEADLACLPSVPPCLGGAAASGDASLAQL
jgi:hypothetical protein